MYNAFEIVFLFWHTKKNKFQIRCTFIHIKKIVPTIFRSLLSGLTRPNNYSVMDDIWT